MKESIYSTINLKTVVLFFMSFLISFYSISQELRGTITSDGEPLPGANVLNLTTGSGVLSDFDGNYILTNVSNGDEIEFSYLGYDSQTIVFSGQLQLNISLVESLTQLNEVIVTGYGSTIQKNLSSSVSKIRSEDLQNTALSSFEQAMQGRAAGVQVVTGSAMSGSQSKIRIRGTNSAIASSDPLYVIDGVIVETGAVSDRSNGVGFMDDGGGNLLSTINPNDIQSIEILKDAAATAIYGARGSSGVVLITTKSGSSGETKVDITIDTGISEVTRKLDFVNAEEYLMLAQEAWYNSGENPTLFWENSGVLVDGLTKAEALSTDTDWQDQALRQGVSYRANVSASGGDEKTKFFISGNFLDEESIFVGNEYNKISARTNLDHKFSDNLTIGTKLFFTYINSSPVPVQNGLGKSNQNLPIHPVYKSDGTYFNPTSSVKASLDNWEYNSKRRTFLANWYLNYKLLDGLSFRSEYGINSVNNNDSQYMSAIIDGNGEAKAFQSAGSRNSWNFKNLLNYKNSFGKHRFDILAGVEASKNTYQVSNIRGIGFSNSTLKTPQDAATQENYYNESAYTFLSILGRVNYDYDGKYLLSITARRDGSSRFGKNRQWGLFPAVSLGYNISEEPFFENIKKTVNYLKLRASYGVSGNAEIGNYAYVSTYSQANYNGGSGITLANIGDDELGWESSTQTNIGVSMQMFDGKLRLDVDAYEKLTEDLLLPYPVSVVSGLTQVITNLGEIENRGIEAKLGITLVENDDFTWDTEFTYAYNTNEVLSIGDNAEGINIPGFGTTSIYIGKPIGIQTLPIWVGVDPASGQDIYRTLDGRDLTVAEGVAEFGSVNNFLNSNRVAYGNPHPDFIGSFSSRLTYKNWSVSTLWNFAVGQNYIASGEQIQGKFAYGSMNITPLRSQLGRWRNPGDVVRVAQVTTAPTIWGRTTEYAADIDYLRMRDLTIAYRFDLEKDSFLKGIDLYAKFTNFLTFTNAPPSMYDPENYVRGGNLNLMDKWKQVPQAKTVNLGINIKL
ncbi:MAG: SusC/RagA family TonB-linked outer membrane protein [Bacteroidota bacterium]|nr:SusC/RagA family TonB-linked outer membrane protein [Bacteroidota bacterium]MEC8601741.1 SusC/RagA family TonB-linked outer membrane protein [Bacteroidota bacterium]